ncbi:MAG: hypothetical protein H6598_02730 [Flavobacteriales bacterium]|nr:hypothetical protein [Flavobacteriales bacterium]
MATFSFFSSLTSTGTTIVSLSESSSFTSGTATFSCMLSTVLIGWPPGGAGIC